MSRRPLAAVASIAVGIATVALAAFVAVAEFPLGVAVLACVLVALASAWHGLLRRGVARAFGLALAALALAAVLVLILAEGRPLENALVVGGAALSLALARVAFEVHVQVNGRVFVNNVSLALYAEAVQRSEYRDAKLRTILDTIPDVLGPDGEGPAIRWIGPGRREHHEAAAILVSNNRYRLGRPLGSGTRPRIDDGVLGIVVVAGGAGEPGAGPQKRWRDWSAAAFEVDAERPVPAGIDGEATVLEPPLRFRIRSGALRVRMARGHPGASPSARIPERALAGVVALVRIATGRDP